MNPYSPPAPAWPAPAAYRANVFVPYGVAPAGPVPKPTVRIAKLVLGIVQCLGLFVGVGLIIGGATATGDVADDLFASGFISLGVWYATLIPYGILNMVWVYKIWSWIPPEHRHTNMWRKYISPGQAVLLMLVPYFNLYWMFVIYLGIGDVFDRLRVAYPTTTPSPRNLAVAMLVVSFIFFPAAPFLHFLFDKHVERLARETQMRMNPAMVTC